MHERGKFVRYALSTFSLIALSNLSKAQQTGQPRITAVEPSSAVTTPGAKVTVVGANFSPDVIVYFGGLQAREITFINASALQTVVPYLRPGNYKLDLKSGGAIIHSDTGFTALPAPVDSTIDRAEELTAKKKIDAAINLFIDVATTNPDYDVRAYAHYRTGELYLARGDYWAASEQAALMWDAKASHGVHSSWRYRLLDEEMIYSISRSNDHDDDLKTADWAIKWDITENPDLRFWRALVNARFGKMERAKADLRFALAAEPENLSYRALAAYIGVLGGDKSQFEGFRDQLVQDARALALLGQAAYISGDQATAQTWWAAQAKIDVSQAKLDCMAGTKHVSYGQTRIGAALLAECVAVAPDSREAKEVKDILAGLSGPAP